MPDPALTIPIDGGTAAALAAHGLRAALIDPADEAQTRAWSRAEASAFHDVAPSEAALVEARADFVEQRSVAVLDDSAARPAVPVGTVASWPVATTVPGGEVRAWAVTGVTVAPTHRRLGIARALLEGELRTAVAAGCPVAVLTVSEATIYGRFGFGPAAWVAQLAVDARRAGWVGPPVPGRVQLVDRDAMLGDARPLMEAARRATVGDVAVTGSRFDRLFGLQSDDEDLRRYRYVRYDDADGAPRGFASYTMTEDPVELVEFEVDVQHLTGTTHDASAALWRYLLGIDLVRTVRASLRSTDDPLRWLVRDQRAIRTTELREHLWVRVLDVAAAFAARTYGGVGRLGLRVADPLGYADGSFVLHADGPGTAWVARAAAPAGVPVLDVPVDLLGSLYLGGVSAATLARAGRIGERAPGDAVEADRLLRSPTTPLLATWF